MIYNKHLGYIWYCFEEMNDKSSDMKLSSNVKYCYDFKKIDFTF